MRRLLPLLLLAGSGLAGCAAVDDGLDYQGGYGRPGGPVWSSSYRDPDEPWRRREYWRERRRAEDQARIEEAARREAERIEQEREQRRAERRAWREQQRYGYGPGYFRGW
jgi:hypothetical protein